MEDVYELCISDRAHLITPGILEKDVVFDDHGLVVRIPELRVCHGTGTSSANLQDLRRVETTPSLEWTMEVLKQEATVCLAMLGEGITDHQTDQITRQILIATVPEANTSGALKNKTTPDLLQKLNARLKQNFDSHEDIDLNSIPTGHEEVIGHTHRPQLDEDRFTTAHRISDSQILVECSSHELAESIQLDKDLRDNLLLIFLASTSFERSSSIIIKPKIHTVMARWVLVTFQNTQEDMVTFQNTQEDMVTFQNAQEDMVTFQNAQEDIKQLSIDNQTASSNKDSFDLKASNYRWRKTSRNRSDASKVKTSVILQEIAVIGLRVVRYCRTRRRWVTKRPRKQKSRVAHDVSRTRTCALEEEQISNLSQ
ncbi:hypothetical protein BDV98DRAFT_640490 [Pterulicium gracile]|uniref:Uncharacterized protein n=1 Tax=Pterulicium gracile TaxID=1884261 RepID=A0A5C3Q205_9AGAR|nr:hypothetical protein BDV98DRAFT_640490 [Pterula gracilis]